MRPPSNSSSPPTAPGPLDQSAANSNTNMDRTGTKRSTVVHIITQLELGGAQENTLYTCEHLDSDRYRVILIYGPGGILDSRAQSSSTYEPITLPSLVREIRPPQDVLAAHQLRKVLKSIQPDIVHTHSSKAGVLGRFAAKAAGVPNIVHSIHGFGFYTGQAQQKYQLFLNAERAAGQVTDAFISVSVANLEEAIRKRIIPRRAIRQVIRSGMNLDDYRTIPSRAKARASLGYAREAELILCIANLKQQKDPLTLMEAFRQLSLSRPHAELLFAGDGPLRNDVEAFLIKHHLHNRVHLLGWRRDIPQLLAAANVVALSSLYEGLPRSAVQAVAAGRTFVGTWVDGTPEIIRNGKNGYLVPPKNPEALALALNKGIEQPLVDPVDQQRLGAWDVNSMVRNQEDIYARLLAAKGR